MNEEIEIHGSAKHDSNRCLHPMETNPMLYLIINKKSRTALTKRSIYYLPGRGGCLHEGLGEALLARNLLVTGRALHGDFKTASFATQVSTIANDLREQHWHEDALVIANSFGAYLFLHAQTELPPFIGRVLLLSPIVGAGDSKALQLGYIPPRARKLHELAVSGQYPKPVDCQIHVGGEDWQANPANVSKLGALLDMRVYIVANNGHMLDKSYVSSLLDVWIARRAT